MIKIKRANFFKLIIFLMLFSLILTACDSSNTSGNIPDGEDNNTYSKYNVLVEVTLSTENIDTNNLVVTTQDYEGETQYASRVDSSDIQSQNNNNKLFYQFNNIKLVADTKIEIEVREDKNIIDKLSMLVSENKLDTVEVNIKDFTGGTGTAEDPFLIENAWQLSNSKNHHGYLKQVADIDLSDYSSEKGWKPIRPNAGYNGNGYVISNLYINRPESENVGLFSYSIVSGTIIKNVKLENVNIIGNEEVGGIIGSFQGGIINSSVSGVIEGNENVGGIIGYQADQGEIIDSHAAVSVLGKGEDNMYIGGLVGKARNKIENCSASGRVEGGSYVGGLTGSIGQEITNSYATGNVIGTDSTIGGLVGYTSDFSIIAKSYASGNVEGRGSVGGLIGSNYGKLEQCYATGDVEISYIHAGGLIGNNGGQVSECYATGKITGSKDNYYNSPLGGLIGYDGSGNKSSIINSYWDINTSNINESDGGEGKNTDEMLQQSTYFSWDFINVWDIDNGNSYPYLTWQDNNIPTPNNN